MEKELANPESTSDVNPVSISGIYPVSTSDVNLVFTFGIHPVSTSNINSMSTPNINSVSTSNNDKSNSDPAKEDDIDKIFENAFYINPCNIVKRKVSKTSLDKNINTKTSSENSKSENKTRNYEETSKSNDPLKLPILSIQALRKAINSLYLKGRWKILETPLGLVIAFTRREESQDIFERIEIAKVLKTPVQVAALPQRCHHQQQLLHQETQRRELQQQIILPQIHNACGETNYIQNRISNFFSGQSALCTRSHQESVGRSRWLVLRDVPWSIPIKDLRHALELQGVHATAVERWRQHARIEVKRLHQYELLLNEGFDFYGVSRFFVTAERQNNANNDSHHFNSDEVLQCYRCQGFWHVALNCRHIPRCVRCGEAHSVEYCMRPRNNPICCNCSGPHHAAYKGCPIRKQMGQAAPVFFTLSKYLPEKSSSPLTPNLNSKEPRCWL